MPEDDPERLIDAARRGDEASLGRLLENYRAYLGLLAGIQVGRRLQGKLDASDLVQETFLEAHRNFERFQGGQEAQLVGWLRAILAARVANSVRHYCGTQGRDVRLEREMAVDLEESSRRLDDGFVDSLSSPSQQAVRREQSVLLASALERLPEDYRAVLVLRHLEALTFPEVARRLGKTLDSVEKLWLRALARLRQVSGGLE